MELWVERERELLYLKIDPSPGLYSTTMQKDIWIAENLQKLSQPLKKLPTLLKILSIFLAAAAIVQISLKFYVVILGWLIDSFNI